MSGIETVGQTGQEGVRLAVKKQRAVLLRVYRRPCVPADWKVVNLSDDGVMA
jgi:hypothetical protein